jgi:hypothetical protein
METAMTRRWWAPFDGMAEVMFKQVPGGWIYRAPSPWIVGPRPYYRLDDQQKEAAFAIHRRFGTITLLAIIVLVVVALPLARPWLNSSPTGTLIGSVLLGLAVGVLINVWLAHAVKPIIAGLEPTSERVTRADVFKTQTAMFSRAFLITFGLLSLAMFAMTVASATVLGKGWDALSVAGALLFGGGAVYWAAMLVAKSRRSGDRS